MTNLLGTASCCSSVTSNAKCFVNLAQSLRLNFKVLKLR